MRKSILVLVLALFVAACNGPAKLGTVLPSGNGQTTSSKSVSVVFASDAPSITVAAGLPDGGATATLQTTGNTSLSSIDGKIPSKGTAVMTGSLPVTIATNDTLGATLATAAAQATQLTSLNLLTMPKSTTTVVPSDSTDTTSFCGKGIWVGVAGDVAVKFLSDSSATTLKNVPSGTFVPGQFLRVMSTNTTATTMVCFGGTG